MRTETSDHERKLGDEDGAPIEGANAARYPYGREKEPAMQPSAWQVGLQYKAVAHMAKSLAEVYSQTQSAAASDASLLAMRGDRSARHMEILGNILNGMDAIDEDADEWMVPVFEWAHRMFPQSSPLSVAPATPDAAVKMTRDNAPYPFCMHPEICCPTRRCMASTCCAD